MTIFGPMIRFLPNALTLCNLIAGTSAIAALFDNNPSVALVLAGLCLFLDISDGYLARRLKVTSALGIQLDSLADLVSFGVFPGFILFSFLHGACNVNSSLTWLPYTAFLVPAGAGLRLARFNLDTRKGDVFYGLPTPSAAAFLFGLLWMSAEAHPWWASLCHSGLLYMLVLLLPLLMLSNIRLWSLKGIGENRGRIILIVFLIVFGLLIWLTGPAGIALMVIVYVLFGLLNYTLKLY